MAEAAPRDPRQATIDCALPFALDRADAHGRIVRLGFVLDRALAAHAYPDVVSERLGEAMALACALAGAMKFDGVFSLQIQGDGPISLIVADCAADGAMRGYARFDAEALDGKSGFAELIGEGRLTLVVDQSRIGKENYTGVTALEGDSLEEAIRAYFKGSAQLKSAIAIACARSEDGAWRAGALLLQALPKKSDAAASDQVDGWRHAMMMMETVTDDELLDPGLPLADALFRLFHELEPRAFDAQPIDHRCSCSAERMMTMLTQFPEAERAEMANEEGEIEVTCQFCSATRRFALEALAVFAETPPERPSSSEAEARGADR